VNENRHVSGIGRPFRTVRCAVPFVQLDVPSLSYCIFKLDFYWKFENVYYFFETL